MSIIAAIGHDSISADPFFAFNDKRSGDLARREDCQSVHLSPKANYSTLAACHARALLKNSTNSSLTTNSLDSPQPAKRTMSSSSSFSSESSSSSSPDTTTFPSSAFAAARMRRHRRDAMSHQAESEWGEAQAQAPPTLFSTSWSWAGDHPVPPPPVTGDELICPLASLPPPSSCPSSFAFPHVDTSLPPDRADDGDVRVDTDLQATLARFAFPSPTRKHRRSGESVDHHSAPPAGAVGGGATRRCGTGAVKRAQCTHCEHA
jgi:hypothetical protein